MGTGTSASTVALGNHTHNYAGSSSAGGAATSAVKLSTAQTIQLTGAVAGSTTFDGSATASISTKAPSAYCDTAAGTAAKTATCTDWTLTSNTFIHVLIKNANSYNGAITLSINGTTAKPIYINGSASSSSNKTLPAGSYIVFYNGTNYYFRTDGKLTADITGNAATATSATSATSATTAATASQLDSSLDKGSATNPIYFSGGKPVACTYSLNKTVPSDAVFTDTHHQAMIVLGNSASDTTSRANLANGNVYLNVVENGSVRSSHKIYGNGGDAATSVTTDSSGNLYISATNTKYSGTSGRIVLSGTAFDLASGVVTAGSAGPTAAVTGNEGNTIAVPRITVDTYGRVTALTSYNLTNKDTKDTAGISNSTAKMYLIGGASQSTSPDKTYSNSNIYATDGALVTKSVAIGASGVAKCTLTWNATTQSCDFVFA